MCSLQRAGAGLASRFRPNHRPSASVFRTLAEWAVKSAFRRVEHPMPQYASQCAAADWRKRRRPTQPRDIETADGKFLLLYVFAIVTSLFFVTKLALGL